MKVWRAETCITRVRRSSLVGKRLAHDSWVGRDNGRRHVWRTPVCSRCLKIDIVSEVEGFCEAVDGHLRKGIVSSPSHDVTMLGGLFLLSVNSCAVGSINFEGQVMSQNVKRIVG